MNVQALMSADAVATFHAIQLVLIGPVAVSVLLLADSFGRSLHGTRQGMAYSWSSSAPMTRLRG